jgi:hypothetical protein
MKPSIISSFICTGLILIGTTQTTFADHLKYVAAKQAIEDLDKTLASAKTTIQFTKPFSEDALPAASFVAFPDSVPASGEKMYASLVNNQDQAYTINIDATPDCNDAKNCNLGKLSFHLGENPSIYYDRDDKQATTAVTLAHGVQGFYTHSFAMADFWPANMQWRDGAVLYTLSWNVNDKAAFIKMANAVINQLHTKK